MGGRRGPKGMLFVLTGSSFTPFNLDCLSFVVFFLCVCVEKTLIWILPTMNPRSSPRNISGSFVTS